MKILDSWICRFLLQIDKVHKGKDVEMVRYFRFAFLLIFSGTHFINVISFGVITKRKFLQDLSLTMNELAIIGLAFAIISVIFCYVRYLRGNGYRSISESMKFSPTFWSGAIIYVVSSFGLRWLIIILVR